MKASNKTLMATIRHQVTDKPIRVHHCAGLTFPFVVSRGTVKIDGFTSYPAALKCAVEKALA